MVTSQQFRAKAAEYRELVEGTDVPSAVREFQNLERSFTELADNEDWLANNLDKTVHPKDKDGEELDYVPGQKIADQVKP